MSELWRTAEGYLAQGGPVMVPLTLLTFVLYYGAGARLVRLLRGGRGNLPERIARLKKPSEAPRGFLDCAIRAALSALGRREEPRLSEQRLQVQAALAPLAAQLGFAGSLTRTIVVVAPLLGLLGTVGGMIEMFDSLGNQTFYAQHGGIAQGISKALFTTQLGLAIAIPGYFLTRLTDRREAALRDDLERVEHLLCGAARPTGGTA